MKILQLQLYVFMCCQASVADEVSDLGSDVIINCDLNDSEVYWMLLKTPDPPTVILRSFPAPKSPHFSNKSFRNKYSVQWNHDLLINNVTNDESGVYYCTSTDSSPKIISSTRLTIRESAPLIHNHTTVEVIDHHQSHWIFIIISGVMNGILLIIVIGLVVLIVGIRRSRKSPEKIKTDSHQMRVIEQNLDPDQLQYATMDFSKVRKKFRSSQVNSTYAALNLPKS